MRSEAQHLHTWMMRLGVVSVIATLLALGSQFTPTRGSEADALSPTFTVESYYRAKWGHADEFIELFRKNHLPVLRELAKQGRILRITAVKPRYHATEEGRWDYRVTLVFRDAVVAHERAAEEPVKKQLFPDQETYKREEQRRFEILDAHWDVPVEDVDLGE